MKARKKPSQNILSVSQIIINNMTKVSVGWQNSRRHVADSKITFIQHWCQITPAARKHYYALELASIEL